MAFEIIWENNGVVRKFSDVVTNLDIQRSFEMVHADPRFSTLRYSINDFLAVSAVDVSKAALASTALRTIGDSQSNGMIFVAFVVTAPDVLALTDFFSSPTYMPYTAKIFSTIAEARQWITSK